MLTFVQKCMAQNIFKLVLTDEAQNFIESLPEAVSYKIYYNIKRVAGGERNKELFKKLENSEIWEFRTLYNKTAYRLFAFWDKDKETLVIATHGIIKKTQKTPSKDSKSRSNKKRIFQKQVIMAQMNLTPLDDVLDKHFGKVGTPKRDAFESDVDGALHAYRLGEAIKKARIEQNLTQEQLGERIGVKRAQISRLERGYSITIPTMRRVFKALGVVTATIDLGIAGKVALW